MKTKTFKVEKVNNGYIVETEFLKQICQSKRDVSILIGDAIMNMIEFKNPVARIEVNIDEVETKDGPF